MCRNISTNQRYLCNCAENFVDLDLCEDYEQLGVCPTPSEYWENKERIHLDSKRVKSICEKCKEKKNEEKQISSQSQYIIQSDQH